MEKRTYDKYFLQRVWYFAAATPYREMQKLEGAGSFLRSSLVTRENDFDTYQETEEEDRRGQSVTHSNMGIGIVVEIGLQHYGIIPEWKKMGISDKKKQRDIVQTVTPDKIICGVDVEIDELLTHVSETVRKFSANRVSLEVKQEE